MAEHGKRMKGVGVVFACLLSVLAVAPAAGAAEFGVGSFTTTASTQQAGAHADFSTSFSLKTDGLGNPFGKMMNVRIELPEGVIGNPEAVQKCTFRSLETATCGSASQVGTFTLSFIGCRGLATSLIAAAEVGATELQVENTEGICPGEAGNNSLLTIGSGASAEQVRVASLQTMNILELSAPIQHEHAMGDSVTHIAEPVEGPLPLFKLKPFPGHVATFGAYLLGITIILEVDISPQGRLVATLEDASSLLPLAGGGVTLWGVPADPSHDAQRCDEFLSECGATDSQITPFMSMPTECSGGQLKTVMTLESWSGETDTGTSLAPPPTGCGLLSIEPKLQVSPETTDADSPSGYEVGVTVPQNTEPYGLATPALKNIAVTLPAGTSLSPAFAEGLGTCTEDQLGSGQCPNSSRMGSAEIVSPLVGEPLEGSVYFGTPTADVKYPLLIRVGGGSVAIQFAGRAVLDPQTGRVTASFQNAPPLPFTEFRLTLFGGNAAALDNPQSCGTATSSAAITAYGGMTAAPTSSFDVQGGCGTSFSPGFIAGSKVPRAAAFSPFSMALTRADGEADLSAFSVELPPGLIGLLRSTTPCGEPHAADGDCPPASAVGTATVGLGAGGAPLSLSGLVYLTGSYGGAQFGLDTVIRGAAGPIDLGAVLVRSRLYVDQKTLALKIVSDPLPQIVGGIPLRMRSLAISLDRPEFAINPSSCGATAITGTAVSATGASHPMSTPFSVFGCNGLRFAPRVSASSPRSGSVRGKGAGLDIHIAPGGATKPTLRSITVTLPRELSPRLTTIQQACLPGAAPLETACGTSSTVGTASLVTPALSQPLTGKAYLVARGKAMPNLVLLLHGGPIIQQLESVLTISKSNVIRTKFTDLPDIPIEEITLNLPRGPHSMLASAGSLCGKRSKLAYTMTDQSSRAVTSSSRIAVRGCRGKRSG